MHSPLEINPAAWDALLARQRTPTPFMRHGYLAALHASGSAVEATGWAPRFQLLWDGDELAAACPLYLKNHSYGEYVFDFAWANAYAEHGLAYYPKALIGVPFTPVPGSRLLARDAASRQALLRAVLGWCRAQELSSLHLLFGDEDDQAAADAEGLLLREQIQFHWKNQAPTLPAAPGSLPPEGADPALGRPGGGSLAPTLPAAPGSLPPEGADPALGRPGGGVAGQGEGRAFADFDDFLASLNQDKRKKIRQERRKVREAGIRFRHAQGAGIRPEDWDFFIRCYQRTYWEHGNAPYLTPEFFRALAHSQPEAWVLFVAEHEGTPIASSLIAVQDDSAPTEGGFGSKIAYGRYWGALARVDSLHFEACYYQPIEWAIAHGVARFEGGAQGEHKMARALLPVRTRSAHWLAHPAFADAVERFLVRETEGVDRYLTHLDGRSPFRQAPPLKAGG